GFYRLSHLAQHPLVRRPLYFALESLKLICLQQGWQLHQPRRRVLAEHLDQLFTRCISAEPSQGFQHRHVGFARTVVLNTLSPPDPYFLLWDELAEEYFHYCCFANPRLACHKNDLSLAVQCLLQPAVELPKFRFTTDQGNV